MKTSLVCVGLLTYSALVGHGEEPASDRRSELKADRTTNSANRVWWDSGYVRSGSDWTAYEAAVATTTADSTLSEYREKREQCLQRADQLVRLAKWCRRHGLLDQFRVHMAQAGRLAPARIANTQPKHLGLVQYEGHWMTPERQDLLRQETTFIANSIKKYGRACRKLAERVNKGIDGDEAMDQSLAVPESVPAIDFILGRAGVNGARKAVQILSQVDSVRASQVLAKYAVFSSAMSVRDTATKALRGRKLEHFVPGLLDQLSTEINVQRVAKTKAPSLVETLLNGPLIREFAFQRILFRETRSLVTKAKSTLVIEPEYLVAEIPVVNGGGNNAEEVNPQAALAAQVQSRAAHLRSELAVSRQNEGIRRINKRAISVLTAVSGEEVTEPGDWWTWWNRYTDVDTPAKAVIEVEEVVERRKSSRPNVLIVQSNVGHSCFAAGTQVLTDSGKQHIEDIWPGDRVLAQHIETGELDFFVVEQTTVRPKPGPTVRVTIGDEKIVCTGGHNFWRAGKGWVQARHLKPGDQVRTITGTRIVDRVEPAAPARTYNLIVESAHNYFVTESAFLVQDLLPPKPTDMIEPGVSRFAAKPLNTAQGESK